MIQDIEPKHLNNQYKPKQPEPEDTVFCFYKGKILLGGDRSSLQFPKYKQLREKAEAVCYLFTIEETAYFLLKEERELSLAGFFYENMFQVRSYTPKEQVFAAATAYHLYVWYRDNRFCGRCGAPLTHSPDQRMLTCTCGNLVFPKIAPAVIVGVVWQDKILMTRYANRDYKRYALVAGFTEIGETPEQTAAREVLEETGVRIRNIRYYKSQPWGFDSNLLLGYFAELDGESAITLDEEELSVAEWVQRDAIETEQDDRTNLSLTREMMLLFRDKERYEAFREENRLPDGSFIE